MRYHLFASSDDFHGGGMSDYVDSFDSLENAVARVETGEKDDDDDEATDYTWAQVVVERDGCLVPVVFGQEIREFAVRKGFKWEYEPFAEEID